MLPPDAYPCFGDWLNINDDTPHDVIYTAFMAHSTRLLSKVPLLLHFCCCNTQQPHLQSHYCAPKISLVD